MIRRHACCDSRPSADSQRDLFDHHASSYTEELNQTVSFINKESTFFTWAKARLLHDLAHAYKLIPGQASLLDVGCGVGSLHHALTDAGLTVYGTDISLEALRIATVGNPESFYSVMNGATLPYKSTSFDMTVAVCVFHHVGEEHRHTLLSEMCRVTRAEGLVAVIDHNPFNPLSRLAVRRCAFDVDAELLPAARIRTLFRAAKLRPLTRYFLFFPFEASLFSFIEKHLGWLGLGAQYCVYGLTK